MPSAKEFEEAMRAMRPPAESVRKMLRAHLRAKNRTSIARELARVAGYKSWRGFNLHYGLLAKRIGAQMKLKGCRIGLLVDFAKPGELRNEEWLVFMRQEFAEALKRTNWV
jgi:hypothetical protein